MPDASDNGVLNDVLDEGLSRLAVTGPEFGSGLSNHGPMAAEALVRLGRADVVEHWLDDYLKRLDAAPRATDRITDQTWREALGVRKRVGDWEAYFRDQMSEQPWQDVLARWWPRLAPGLAAAGTHGIIRTSHAARSLAAAEAAAAAEGAGVASATVTGGIAAAEGAAVAGGTVGAGSATARTAERRDELARGLAYWAASYLQLPGTPRTAGTLDLGAALQGLPLASQPPARGLITEGLTTGLAGEQRFGPAVAALRPPADVAADLLAFGREFTRIFLAYGGERPITLLHAVTAPVAARSVLPLLPDAVARPTYDALWQVGAGLYAVYAGGVVPRPLPTAAPPSPDEVTDQAVATGDEHAIKLTEACLRLHAESPDPLFLHAAARASELLG
jgi:Questin oxidase-like